MPYPDRSIRIGAYARGVLWYGIEHAKGPESQKYSNQEQSHLEIHEIHFEKIDLHFFGPPRVVILSVTMPT